MEQWKMGNGIQTCKECTPPTRHVGCHSTCQKYLNACKEAKKQKEIIAAAKQKDDVYYNHHLSAIRKQIRGKVVY